MNLVQAINDALKLEMKRDPKVVVLGEDVGRVGGVFRVTQGLWDEFGDDRVVDTPLSEGGIIGTAIGMALYGLVPVPEIQFADFIYPAYDQIVNELAKFRYRSGGQYTAPVVIRTPYGGGIRGGHYHSQSPEAYFVHTPGLKVVIPSNPYDAKGLLLSAIRGEDPVLFMEPKRVYRASKGDVPEGDYTLPLGKAAMRRVGSDLAVISYGACVHLALRVAERLAADGIQASVLDLRSLAPLDRDAVLSVARRSSRVLIVHEDTRTGGIGESLAALIQEHAFEWLDAPVSVLGALDTPVPYSPPLEAVFLPSEDEVEQAARRLLAY
jgi:2-oxoisovalerate dehydrogenase E1 component beta subunit